MLYFGYDHKLGEEDAYDRVLDGEHRDVVKKAFIAMVQSSSQLNRKPTSLNMDVINKKVSHDISQSDNCKLAKPCKLYY